MEILYICNNETVYPLFLSMKKFLEYVAEDIINKHGTDLSRMAIVFPNKRASLFLNDLLARMANRPIWSPSYITISEFFRRHSSLVVADPIKLICDVHKSFVKCTGIDESIDHFFGWGQLLIADFDDLDKNMADASNVFRNVKNIHELDDLSYLDDDQKDILRKFFSNFTEDDNSELKRRFLRLWSHIEDIYNDFRDRLKRQSIAYEGMLYREVASNPPHDCFYDKYIFVGFNLLQKVEQQVFMNLQKEGRAHFYWDFDDYYMPKSGWTYAVNEAGRYIAQYLKLFPNELDCSDAGAYSNFRSHKDITYVSATTENVQARYVTDWLREKCRYDDGRNTAIVLCDESLLPAVIRCIPKEVESVNITTGFPLFQTAISSYVFQLLDLRINGFSPANGFFRAKYVVQLLSHPYSRFVSGKSLSLLERIKAERIYRPKASDLAVDEGTAVLFGTLTDNKTLVRWLLDILKIIAHGCGNEDKDPLMHESLFRMYTLCNRLNELVCSGDLEADIVTLQKLIVQLVNSTTIPFHGEPVEGIQIMGILETRNIDFDHVLLLSCNEGNMPKGVNDSSFIPYSIRKAHGLTTVDNKVSIYAYYFYNLVQRASDVTIVYNKSTEDGHTGEMSRFMLQLMIEGDHDIRRVALQTEQFVVPSRVADIPKDTSVMTVLNGMEYISPTSINRYMRCPLQFYYANVARIKEPDEDEFEEMSGRLFGNVFHYASEKLYKELRRQDGTVVAESIDHALEHKEMIGRMVDEAFAETVFEKKPGGRFDYNGLQLINREVIIRYLRRLLEIDRSLAPFRITDVEATAYSSVTVPTSVGCRHVNIGGRIDRLDRIFDKSTQSERLRVIDYKTGRYSIKKINGVDEIFLMPAEQGKHADYYLQTMLYAMIVRHDDKLNPANLPVSPALLFIQHSAEDDYDPTLTFGKDKILDIAQYEEAFSKGVSSVLSEIFEPSTPFRPTEDRAACSFCPYKGLCGL